MTEGHHYKCTREFLSCGKARIREIMRLNATGIQEYKISHASNLTFLLLLPAFLFLFFSFFSLAFYMPQLIGSCAYLSGNLRECDPKWETCCIFRFFRSPFFVLSYFVGQTVDRCLFAYHDESLERDRNPWVDSHHSGVLSFSFFLFFVFFLCELYFRFMSQSIGSCA